MTCIVAIEHTDGVIVAADRCVTYGGYNIEIKAQPKIWRSGECIVGASGPVRLGNILRTLDIPIHACGWDVDYWVVRDFIPACIALLAEHQYEKKTDGKADSDGNILFVVRGRVYCIWSDWSWTRNTTGEYVIGSGYQNAAGSLSSTRTFVGNAKERAIYALHAAAEHQSDVAEPFDILTMERPA